MELFRKPSFASVTSHPDKAGRFPVALSKGLAGRAGLLPGLSVTEPPMRYLARQRFEQASARLRYSADPIARIAFEVGYESEAAFNRAFRPEYGVPPASWRRDRMAGKA
jgi:AraC-like DNA-binding protein